MLPKKYRIGAELFTKLRHPERRSGRYFSASLYALPAGEVNSKAACVISKKTSTNAVVRNRIRRRTYAALREIVKNTKNPIAIVVYPRAEAQTASYEEVQKDLSGVLK